jgi:hypothetical protein
VLVSDLLGSVTPSGDPLKQLMALSLFVVMIIVNTWVLRRAAELLGCCCPS